MRLALVLISFSICVTPLYAEEKTAFLNLPPASLSKWYKPENKRNVWHHNMFKLRRETQAVNEYMAEKDQINTEKWGLRLIEHYKKIGEMIPEWKDDLELEWAEKLEVALTKGDFTLVKRAMNKINTSCKGCHDDYRAQVAAIYRAPDFSNIHVQLNEEETSYLDFMKILMRDINRIKISSEDGNKPKARQALKAVRSGIKTLRTSCESCHKDNDARDYYLGKKTADMLDKLEAAIETGKSGRALGGLAVQACAKCHGSHRIIYDLKGELK